MTKTKVQKSAPVNTAVGLTIKDWGTLQFQAATQDGGIREVLGKGAKTTVAIDLPVTFVALVQRTLKERGIPQSYLPSALANVLLNAYLGVEGEPLVSSYVYPNRAKAYSAAVDTFVKSHWQSSLVLSYRQDRRVESELFRNPISAIKAA